MLRAAVPIVGLVLLGALAGCGGEEDCTVGETEACTCANGNSGLRTCRSDGALSACICATVTPDATGDTTVTPDAAGADSDCVPKCDGWECGDDGCGGTCGSCAGGEPCLNGACTACPSLTCCDMRFTAPIAGLTGFGGGCTDDRECVFQECLLPGEPGNITNSVFGFCTRGCDCNDNTASQLSDTEDDVYTCLLPPGSTLHHLVLQCNTLSDCVQRDPRWTACRPGTSGTAKKICFAE
jgi:hypothetical protein